MTSFIMQAVGFWDKFVAVTKEATIETEHLERIVKLAGKKTNRVRILRGGGTQTKMTSFKERWMEVAEMNSSDGNNVTFKEVALILLFFFWYQKLTLRCDQFFLPLILLIAIHFLDTNVFSVALGCSCEKQKLMLQSKKEVEFAHALRCTLF